MNPTTSYRGAVIYRFTLRFRNGESVSATICPQNPTQNCPVLYAGAVKRLPHRFEFADPLLLKVLFRSFARELKARFAEEMRAVEEHQGEVMENETTPWQSEESHGLPSHSTPLGR